MNIAVFCGSSSGKSEVYEQSAEEFGKLLVQNSCGLVYGGGNIGIMGAIANSVLENGGFVSGIIPKSLEEKELAHTGIQELIVVDNMHQRKALMAQKCDAFVAMPGGIGTLEEIFEAWTWAQLGYHKKPIAFLNSNGFYTKLFDFLTSIQEEGFVKSELLKMAIVEEDMNQLLDRIMTYQAPKPKWA
jgi:hypothetical protein